MAGSSTRGSARKKTPSKKAEEAKTAPAPAPASNKPTTRKDDGKQEQKQQPSQEPQHHPLERVTEGMNPRSLLTGLYGTRGERIRHVVRNGALSMPKESLDLMAEFEGKDQKQKIQGPSKKKARKAYQLPGLDSVVRPSADKSMRSITVTDIFQKQSPNPSDSTQPPIWKTVAENRIVNFNQSSNTGDAERIRGGGEDDAPTGNTPPTEGGQSSGGTGAASAEAPKEETSSQPHAQESETTKAAPSPAPAPTEAAPAPAPASDPTSQTQATTSAEAPATATAPSNPSATAGAPSQVANPTTAPTASSQPAAASATNPPSPAAAPVTVQPAAASANQAKAEPAAPTSSSQAGASAQSSAPASQSPTPTQPAAPTESQAPASAQPTTSTTSQAPVTPAQTTAPTTQAPAPAQTTAPTTQAPTPAQAAASTTQAPVPDKPAASNAQAPGPAKPAAPTSTAPAPAPAQPAAPTSQATAPATSSPAPAPSKATPVAATATPSSDSQHAPAATEKVIPLTKKPAPHWNQHIPSANDENMTDPQAKTPRPDWYDPKTVSSLERSLLPEWFDDSASHRTEESYIKARETMIRISDQLGNRYVTSTLTRRSLPGDVGSLHRLHQFLTLYMWINEDGRNDSMPTAASLQQPPQLGARGVWTDKRRGDLMHAVVAVSQQSSKKRKANDDDDPMDVDGEYQDNDSTFVPIDWDEIAEKVGASPGECEREFLAMPLDGSAVAVGNSTERPITPDTTTSEAKAQPPKDAMPQEEFLRSLVDNTSPKVIEAVTRAALQATGQELSEAQNAARLGLVASQAVKAAQGHEETVSRLLSEVVDQRMQKLESRMSLMDDLEGLLEAERVALELERRDLYTTRCRDWFGGA